MAYCYRIPYEDRFGTHFATKWGEDAAEARQLVAKSAHNRSCGLRQVGTPELVIPQPFGGALPPAPTPKSAFTPETPDARPQTPRPAPPARASQLSLI